jgi:hypothetical protein
MPFFSVKSFAVCLQKKKISSDLSLHYIKEATFSVKIFNVFLLQKNKIPEDQMIMKSTALCQKDNDKEQWYFSQY